MKGDSRRDYAKMLDGLIPDIQLKTAEAACPGCKGTNLKQQWVMDTPYLKCQDCGKEFGSDELINSELFEPYGEEKGPSSNVASKTGVLDGLDLGSCFNCKFFGTEAGAQGSTERRDTTCNNPESEYYGYIPGSLRCSLYQQGDIDFSEMWGKAGVSKTAAWGPEIGATCPECKTHSEYTGKNDWYECPGCGMQFDPRLDARIYPETLEDIRESREYSETYEEPEAENRWPAFGKRAYKTMKQHGDTDTWDVFGDNGELLMSEESYQVASNFVGIPAGEWSETDAVDIKPPNRNQQDAFGSKSASLIEKTEQAVLDWFSTQGWEVDYAGLEPSPVPGTEVMIIRPWHPMDADMPEWKELADRLPQEVAGIRSAIYSPDTDSIGIELVRGEELFDDMEHEHMGSLRTSAREYSANELEQARALGEQAFLAGKPSNPGVCPEFMEMLQGNQVGEGLPLFDAWDKGWHGANVGADVPGWTDEENQALRDARGAKSIQAEDFDIDSGFPLGEFRECEKCHEDKPCEAIDLPTGDHAWYCAECAKSEEVLPN